jgi:hypothetical protein
MEVLYMASSLIHVAVCNELNKKLGRDRAKMLIGIIAPDISKLVGKSKYYSHFLDDEDGSIPNLTRFLNRYIKYLDDDYVLGYYIHLDKIINKAREIYEESKVHKDYVFDMDNINSFISLSVKLIESDLRELKVIN